MKAEAPGALLWFVAGFGIWSLCFVLLYAAQAVGCDEGWHEAAFGPTTVQGAVLGTVFSVHLATLAVLSAIAWRWWREVGSGGSGRFVRVSAIVLTTAALAATLWTGLPAVLLRPCI